MQSGLAFDFESYLNERRELVEQGLNTFLSKNDPPKLWESMRYSVLSGGKRIRALLCLAAAEAVTKSSEEARSLALPCACAVEMIHAMSLVHDDLPCMDNDDLRRGRPTNHKVYGEAMALLAGDALLLLASEILLKETSPAVERNRLIQVATRLSVAAGPEGMVGGQVADMEMTGKSTSFKDTASSAEFLRGIHKRKTGALLEFSIWSGAALVGADENTLDALSRYGQILGISFQVADDLLDVTGDIKALGKTPGKDQAADKLTWLSVYGMENARQQLLTWEREGKEVLENSELSAESIKPLLGLLELAIHRKN
ncbi:MAG: polyprenyl synthetase family protein [Candidatus Obscuribacterales bacterium]|jgi:geranylgeranyl diphosphate synthase, type II|nr:polyprenyl synthetase family protein [Candidatus Obscuribacterales bacterium]